MRIPGQGAAFAASSRPHRRGAALDAVSRTLGQAPGLPPPRAPSARMPPPRAPSARASRSLGRGAALAAASHALRKPGLDVAPPPPPPCAPSVGCLADSAALHAAFSKGWARKGPLRGSSPHQADS